MESAVVAKIIVFGGSGFIGLRLVEELLSLGHDVRIADITEPAGLPDRFEYCDISDCPTMEQVLRGADVVYNLAAEHRDDVSPISRYYDVNVGGTRNILAAAEKLGISKMIFTSSVAVYGPNEAELSEDMPTQPDNHYGKSKLEAEAEYAKWQQAGSDRTLVTVRPTVVFGEGNRGNFYSLARQISAGRFLMFGSGRNRKSVAYVENLAAFLVHCLGHGVGAFVVNYADGPDWEMNKMVSYIRVRLGKPERFPIRLPLWLGLIIGRLFDLVAAVRGRPMVISAVRVRKFCADSRVSTERLLQTGFKRPFDKREALDRTLAFEFGKAALQNEPPAPGK